MLVCTEVVFRSYGGNSGPISFPLQQIMGRQTMPASTFLQGSGSYVLRSIGPLGWVLLWMTVLCGVAGAIDSAVRAKRNMT